MLLLLLFFFLKFFFYVYPLTNEIEARMKNICLAAKFFFLS